MVARPLVLAHRGACRVAPENTVAAFEQAAALGADGVELDVRRTADGALVVHHDALVEGFGLLHEQPFAALRAARPEVPTLAEALAACEGLLVNVEIKNFPDDPDFDPSQQVTLDTLDLLRATPGDYVVSSFNLATVNLVREAAPELATAWLTMGLDAERAVARCVEHGHAWWHPDFGALAAGAAPAAVAHAHEHGVRVDVWTVDHPDLVRALAAAGVDAVITNVPDVALASLAS